MMQSQPESAAALARLQAEVARLQRIIQLKDEHIRLLNFRIFGPKADQLSSAQMPLLLAEVSLTTGEVDQEAGRPEEQKQNLLPPAQQPRRAHPGREHLQASLERREETIPCWPEDCRCSNLSSDSAVSFARRFRLFDPNAHTCCLAINSLVTSILRDLCLGLTRTQIAQRLSAC